MDYTFTVKRTRQSVTQGTATVYLNGVELVTFGDTIKLIKEDQAFYGENIGGWASTKPDGEFIRGVLWHPYDRVYHYSNMIDDILRAGELRRPADKKPASLEE